MNLLQAEFEQLCLETFQAGPAPYDETVRADPGFPASPATPENARGPENPAAAENSLPVYQVATVHTQEGSETGRPEDVFLDQLLYE